MLLSFLVLIIEDIKIIIIRIVYWNNQIMKRGKGRYKLFFAVVMHQISHIIVHIK